MLSRVLGRIKVQVRRSRLQEDHSLRWASRKAPVGRNVGFLVSVRELTWGTQSAPNSVADRRSEGELAPTAASSPVAQDY